MKYILSSMLLLVPLFAGALEVEKVKVEDSIQLDKYALVLNGAGLRKRLMFKGYIGALYLEKKTANADAVLADTGAKRMAYFMLRDVGGKQMLERINEAIVANNTIDDMKVLETRFARMEKIFIDMKELKEGDSIFMDFMPGAGTRILVNGGVRGTIEGDDFYRALLKNWIGDRPVQASLKKSVLGQDK